MAVIVLKKDGMQWELRPEFEPILEECLNGQGRVVKESPAKLVTVQEINGQKVYVKRYRNAAIRWRPLKYFFKQSHACSEWETAKKLEALNIPMIRHLAFGERWSWGGLQESILITEGFDGVSLNQFPDRHLDQTQIALARLMRQKHDAGVLQKDLPHNILLRRDPFELRRVDVYGARVGSPLTERERMENLAFLNITVPLKNIFFEVYGWNTEQARRTREHSDFIRRGHYATWARRCLRHNNEFAPLNAGGLKWQVRTPFLNGRLQEILDDPNGFLETKARRLKSGRAATIGSAHGLVIKRFNFRTRKKRNLLKDLFRRSRAVRAYQGAYHLEVQGIATARPVAVAERRRWRFLMESYFVMEEIPGALDLGQYLQHLQEPDPILMRRISELIARLHREGFCHGDLKETNLLFDADRKPFLIDSDGLSFKVYVSERLAAEDLLRLAQAAAKYPCVAQRHRIAFLRHYCRIRGLKRVPRVQPARHQRTSAI